jgi:hypothetical protein
VRRALVAAILCLGLLGVAGVASGLQLRAGDLIVRAHGGFAPKALPRNHDAPISLHGGGRLSTASGGLPPIIEDLILEYDRHGHVETKGLPVCRRGRLEATTVPQARHHCPGAIVGKGRARAIIAFPEQAPIRASSPITIFNGPRKHGNPTVLAHAYTTIPVPTTFIVPIVIERIHRGIYGYRTKAKIPRIAGGAGVPISGFLKIGRKWTYKGKRHSYLNARCQTGRLQVRGKFAFKNGTVLSGSFLKGCRVRR